MSTPSAARLHTAVPIHARDLHKRFGNTTVLQSLSCEIQAGEFVAIMGDSGSGKTTFLNLLAGLDAADRGSLRVGDVELVGSTATGLADYRRTHAALIFQDFNLLPTLNVLENVTLPALLRGNDSRQALQQLEERARNYLERVGMHTHLHKLPETLSGGESQRVAIARALTLQPGLLLADEPTGSLDSRNSREVLQLLGEINRETGLTLVMVTHSEQAAAVAGRCLKMEDGRFV